MEDHKEHMDQELEGLNRFEPSMRFAKNVVDRVKTETVLLKPQRGPLYWVPRLCLGGFILISLLFVFILAESSFELSLEQIMYENRQMTLAVMGVGLGVPAYMMLDRLLKKLVLP